jgi:two-component system sensor histidine kinase FlrB
MGVLSSRQIEGLEESFQTFNQLTESLEHTYTRLEDRVAKLHVKLAEVEEQRQAENDEFDRAADRFNTILNALPAGVVVLDGSGRVQDCNPAAIDLLGGPLRGEVWLNVVTRAFAPQSDDGHEVSLKDGRLVSLSTCPLGNDPGQVLLLNDVTETRHLQQRLNQHHRLAAMGQMAAGVAHQIRTPLSAGLLYGSQLKSHKLDDARRGELLDKVLKHMRHLENLVNDMLLFSKTGYTGTDEINIPSLLHNVSEEIRQACANNGIALTVHSDTEDSIVIGNETVLQSAISNLANNAIQAMAAGGSLNIESHSQELGSVDVMITDTGPGIPEDVKEKIFNPFFTTRSQGTGLGLSVVQAIARAHQGEVWLDPEYQNGTRFILRLPVAIPHTQIEAE